MFGHICLMALTLGVIQASWQNDWDEPHMKECDSVKGQYVTSVKSVHENFYEDRRWEVQCGGSGATKQCSWSGFVNDFDKPVNFECHDGQVLTGWISEHENYYEDRRFNFKCCRIPERHPKNCVWSAYQNEFDGPLNFAVPQGRAICGVHSYHENHYEDRRWKFDVCDI